MKKLYLLFPLSVIAFCILLFYSFRTAEVSFTLEGTVLDQNEQPVFGANVILDKENGEEVPYFEPTNRSGKFTLRFNAVEGKPLNLYIEKESFIAVVQEIIPSTSREQKPLTIRLQPNPEYTLKTAIPKKAADRSQPVGNR